LENAFGAEDRAARAEEQLEKLSASYEELKRALTQQSAGLHKLVAADERAATAEQRLTQMIDEYRDLGQAFQSMADNLKHMEGNAPRPTSTELDGVLNTLSATSSCRSGA